MSELSVRQYLHNDGSGLTWGYDKREADKVIEEKDETIDELKERNDELQKATDSAWSKVNAMYDELLHQKYKRCLAMARLCLSKDCQMLHEASDSGTFFKESWFWKRALWYGKWTRRWLELAEKFKEAK